ncbi:hypothetical protein K2173_006394 [Erythroxylum novogranatense]|uniref:DUF4005 domain-containing protein n=1 Tax=Erythroxylum novogranatense TaxID=1862640 RepID=A0AAV8U6K6_9ROSI|nr:hypothetical protein K2173_006394 [Erythroxylum novogranatense]
MGKSPTRWFKSFIHGKKSSKSNLSKGNDALKQANKEVDFPSKAPVSDMTINHPRVALMVPETIAGSEFNPDYGVSSNLPHEGVTFPCAEGDGKAKHICSTDDPEKINLDKAATKVQAAFRSYLAHRAFRRLKGIIRLQALIHGHLVRRQAAATLCCLQAIVRIQALARGQKVRRSTIGIDVHNKCNLERLQGAKFTESSGTTMSTLAEQLKENTFGWKLLASTSSRRPLCMHYDPGDPNSAGEWLGRWTRSHIWEVCSQVKNANLKSQKMHDNLQGVKAKQGRRKQGQRKLSGAKIANTSGPSISESERQKQNPRKLSNQPADSTPGHSQNASEKVKLTLRKTSNSLKKSGERFEVDKKKSNLILTKASNAATSLDSLPDSVEKIKDTVLAVPELIEVNTSLIAPDLGEHDEVLHKNPNLDSQTNEEYDKVGEVQETSRQQKTRDDNSSVEARNHSQEEVKLGEHDEVLHENPNFDSQPEEYDKVGDVQETSRQQETKDDNSSVEVRNHSQRKTSLPPHIESEEIGVNSTPKLPSYMTPTKSAKCKLREQGSPRFSQDGFEKSSTARRHSLTSSSNGKLTSTSLRAQSMVQAAGKGAIRSDKSLPSTRGVTGKIPLFFCMLALKLFWLRFFCCVSSCMKGFF